MAGIIGRGRYARETYPERSSSSSGSEIQVGYDGSIEEFEFDTNSGLYVPRDSSTDPVNPIQVTFTSFQLGDTLEVDFKMNGPVSADEPATVTVSTQIAVSIDGGGLFYTLTPSGAQAVVVTDGINVAFLRSLDAITIVDPMPVVVNDVPGTAPVTAPPIVRVFFQFSDPTAVMLLNGGTSELTLPSAILKCREVLGSSVFQGPLGQLATTFT